MSTPRALLAAFFVSGASGLVYQVVWARELQLLLGTSTLATSAVLVAFMGGFALGSRLLGALEERARRPLAVYGAVELGIGLSALAVPRAIAAIRPGYGALVRAWPGAVPELRFLAAVLVLLVPTALMGASLPAIVADASRRGGDARRALPALYAANLAGAILGAVLSGFYLVERLGLAGTNGAAACANLAVACWAILAARPREASPVVEAHVRRAGVNLAFLFLSGFVVLALEVVWTRLLVFSLGSSVQAFAVVLSSTLLGLALGATLAPRWILPSEDALGRLALGHAGAAASALAGLVLAPRLFDFMLALAKLTGTGGGAFIFACYLVAGLVLLVPAALLGLAFPSFAALESAGTDRRGAAVGRAQAVNGAGSVLGAAAAGLLLVPRLGIAGSLALCAGIELAGAVFLARASGSRRVALSVGGATLASAMLFACHARPAELDGILRAERGGRPVAVLAWREGSTGTCSVVEDDRGRSLRIDGFEAAAIGETYRYMRLMGVAPLLLQPAPREALVICFGTGTTAGTVASDRGLASLDVVEIEPRVFELAPFFEERNRGVLHDPRVHAHVEDGRAFLAAAEPASLDLVTLEPLPPVHAGVVALYSREFYELGARALRPSGVFCQWVPTQFLRAEDTREICATFAAVFPNSVLLMMDTTGVLLGTNGGRPLLDLRALEARITPDLDRELTAIGVGGARGLVASCALDRAALGHFVEGAPLITDDRPRIEHVPPRHRVVTYVGDVTAAQAESLLAIAAAGSGPSREIAPEVEPWRRLAVAAIGAKVETGAGRFDLGAARLRALAAELQGEPAASAHLAAAQLLLGAGKRDEAGAEIDRAAAIAPAHPGLARARAALSGG